MSYKKYIKKAKKLTKSKGFKRAISNLTSYNKAFETDFGGVGRDVFKGL